MKYDKVTDIPEDVIYFIENTDCDLEFYQRTPIGHVGSANADSRWVDGTKPIWTKKAIEAAKECLARCEGDGKWEVGDTVRIIDDLEPNSRCGGFAGKEVEIIGLFNDSDGDECFAFQHYLLGYGCLSIRAIEVKTEAELAAEKAAEELQCEIDMINAYLEQMNNTLSYYDVQMLAKYIINREGK